MRSLGRLTREYRAETRADVTTPRSVFSHYHVPRGTRVYKATRRHPGSANRAPSPTALSVTDKSLSLVYILLYTLDNYNTVSLPPPRSSLSAISPCQRSSCSHPFFATDNISSSLSTRHAMRTGIRALTSRWAPSYTRFLRALVLPADYLENDSWPVYFFLSTLSSDSRSTRLRLGAARTPLCSTSFFTPARWVEGEGRFALIQSVLTFSYALALVDPR